VLGSSRVEATVKYTPPNKRLWKLPTFTQLRATWYTDSLDMVVLSSTGTSRYQSCCIDGGTSPEYFECTLLRYIALFIIIVYKYYNYLYYIYIIYTYYILYTRWRSWLRHCAKNRKVVGSIPDGVIGIFHWHNPSGRAMALGSTQPVTEMSTRNISWGGRCVGLTTLPPSCADFLKIWEPQPPGTLRACQGL
jgi:hypothetical protein